MDARSKKHGDEESLTFDFARYFAAVRKHKWIIAAMVVVAMTGAVILTNRMTPVYQATASIKIDPRLPDLMGQGASELVQIGAGGGSSAQEYYKGERKILESYQLVRRTVEENGLHLKLLSDSEREGRTVDEVMDRAARRLSADLDITYPEPNRIFYVTARNADPQLAADIANAHVAVYVAYTKGILSTGTQKASRFLASEYELAEKDLLEADNKLVEFQNAHKDIGVSLQDRQSMVTAEIVRYTERVNDARARRIELTALLERMRKIDPKNVLDSPVFGLTSSVTLETLKSQYYTEYNAYLRLEKDLGPKNPELIKQRAVVEQLFAALKSESDLAMRTVKEQIAAAADTEQALQKEVDKYKAESMELAPKLVAYNKLLLDKKSEQDQYNIVVARLGTSDINSRLDTINVTPLDAARRPTSPVSPSLEKNVQAAGAIALFLGIALAMLLAYLDRSIKSAEDIEAAVTQMPVIGVIPHLTEADLPASDHKARDMYVFRHSTSRVAECCRALRTNILFSSADRKISTLVVTSASPRDGKTTMVMYLGTTMAQSGQRVLLVDTDMRRPRLHEATGVSRQRGLTDLIVGQSGIEDCVKSTEIPNLFVLPCGPLPPNPAELLMTKRFEAVLAELKDRYDLVILDSPPLQAVTDAVVLSRMADGVILVVKAGRTLRDDVADSARQFKAVGSTITGAILNELDMDKRRYGGGYYYNYAYGQDKEPAADAKMA